MPRLLWESCGSAGDPNGEGRPEWKAFHGGFDVNLLCNQAHMLPADQMDRYYCFMEKLERSRYAVGIHCLPRFTP